MSTQSDYQKQAEELLKVLRSDNWFKVPVRTEGDASMTEISKQIESLRDAVLTGFAAMTAATLSRD